MQHLPVTIAGLGKFLPERVVENVELESSMGLASGWIERATGVVRRHRAPLGASTADMGASAARQAIERANLSIGDIDCIVAASSGPQQTIPCTASLVQKALGAPDGGSACFDVNATCLSFLVALDLVAPQVAMGRYRAALIVSSESVGQSLNPAEPESAALMGDAAAAAVVVRTPDGGSGALRHVQFETHATAGAELTRLLGGGQTFHPNDPATRAETNLFAMEGPKVFRLAARVFPPFFERFLESADVSREEIDLVVPHQASGRGVFGVAAGCKVPGDRLFVNLPERGNCVAASIPLALCEAWESGRVRRGDRVLLAGTGAGLTLGAAYLTF